MDSNWLLLINEIDIKPRSSLIDIIDFGLFYLYVWMIAAFYFFYITYYASESSFMRKLTFSILIVPRTSNLRTTCIINTYCSVSSKMIIAGWYLYIFMYENICQNISFSQGWQKWPKHNTESTAYFYDRCNKSFDTMISYFQSFPSI